MIDAMPAILRQFPDAMYVIQGKPHPTGWQVKEYYEMLQEKVWDQDLDDSVVFFNAYAATEQLVEFLRGAHVYVNPYVDHTQSVSGTLAMALSTGAAVVSTPYPYAEEMLRKNNTGVLVPFRDSEALANAIIRLLADEKVLGDYNKRAYEAAKTMTWERVGARFIEVAMAL